VTTNKLSDDQLSEIETIITPAMFKTLFGIVKHDFDATFENFKIQAREALLVEGSDRTPNDVNE
jgi:hypothetical protein